MNKSEFVTQLSECCEFKNDHFTLDTHFKSIPDYDSLALMSFIAFADENFSMKFSARELRDLTDFNSFIALIGEDKFDKE